MLGRVELLNIDDIGIFFKVIQKVFDFLKYITEKNFILHLIINDDLAQHYSKIS